MKDHNMTDDTRQQYQKYRRTTDVKQIQTNFGYFEIDKKYEYIEEVVGKWSNAIICRDKDNQQKVAINKIVHQYLQDTCLCKKLLRNLKLKRILKHENILGLINISLPQSREDLQNIYCVSEAFKAQLNYIITSKQQLMDDHYKYFLYQILNALKYIHSANIIHRDLKPSNILVNKHGQIKIASFMDCKIINPAIIKFPDNLTTYITTRWYRAPEVLLGSKKYDQAIDMWAVGCVFAELLLNKPLFPAPDCIHQLELIINLLGTPKLQNFNIISETQFQKLIDHFGQRPPMDLTEHIPNATEQALDLLKRLLTFDPQERITATEALSHPYLAELHEPDDEPVADALNFVDFEFENLDLNIEQLKDCVYEEILLYNFKDYREEYEKKSSGQSQYSEIDNRGQYIGTQQQHIN